MAMDENVLTWNATNWLTVVVMVALAFVLVGFFQSWYVQRVQKKG